MRSFRDVPAQRNRLNAEGQIDRLQSILSAAGRSLAAMQDEQPAAGYHGYVVVRVAIQVSDGKARDRSANHRDGRWRQEPAPRRVVDQHGRAPAAVDGYRHASRRAASAQCTRREGRDPSGHGNGGGLAKRAPAFDRDSVEPAPAAGREEDARPAILLEISRCEKLRRAGSGDNDRGIAERFWKLPLRDSIEGLPRLRGERFGVGEVNGQEAAAVGRISGDEVGIAVSVQVGAGKRQRREYAGGERELAPVLAPVDWPERSVGELRAEPGLRAHDKRRLRRGTGSGRHERGRRQQERPGSTMARQRRLECSQHLLTSGHK